VAQHHGKVLRSRDEVALELGNASACKVRQSLEGREDTIKVFPSRGWVPLLLRQLIRSGLASHPKCLTFAHPRQSLHCEADERSALRCHKLVDHGKAFEVGDRRAPQEDLKAPEKL